MKIKNFLLIFLIFLIVLSSCSNQNSVLIDNGNENISINVEIADNGKERAEGLMFRNSLEQDSGMLFVFESEDYHSFWMKNTLIPLDIMFISNNFEIVDVKYMDLCKEDPCQSYRSLKPAKYALEANGNFTIKKNIKIGNKIRIQ